MLKKSDLAPGMRVKHRGTGKIGEVRGDRRRPSELCESRSDCIAVRFRDRFGKEWRYEYWDLNKLEKTDS